MLTYSQLDFQDLLDHFGVEVRNQPFLPVPVQPLALPNWLRLFLLDNPLTPTVTKSEKAVSEVIIYPVLSALRTHFGGKLGIFSGEPLSAAGLTGVCDFILTNAPDLYIARPPLMVLVEAKRQNLLKAIPQCVAEMIAAQQLNKDAGVGFPAVYGCVTTGNQWQFLRLIGQNALTDPRIFYHPDLESILGALAWIIEQFR